MANQSAQKWPQTLVQLIICQHYADKCQNCRSLDGVPDVKSLLHLCFVRAHLF